MHPSRLLCHLLKGIALARAKGKRQSLQKRASDTRCADIPDRTDGKWRWKVSRWDGTLWGIGFEPRGPRITVLALMP